MSRIAIIGAGITGVTTAYELSQRGFDVSVFERHRYAAMETSLANGGQLSACNAEVWNSAATVLKGLRWMLRRDAPLLVNPLPGWHKYSWMAEFLGNIPHYRAHTVQTVRLALAAQHHLFDVAEREGIAFDLARRGILHFYPTRRQFQAAEKVNRLLRSGGLERYAVSGEEMRAIEPALTHSGHAGFYTPSDATGDIHQFSRGLALACARRGVAFHYDTSVEQLRADGGQVRVSARHDGVAEVRHFDALVICAGVASRAFAAMLGDHVNIYPVKGYSITLELQDALSAQAAPSVSLLDEGAKIVTSRLGRERLRVAGTAEINGFNLDIRADRVQPLIAWTRRHFPQVATDRVMRWAGLRPMMPSMLPKVDAGRRPGVYYNTGHGHLGWTLSAATATAIAERIARAPR